MKQKILFLFLFLFALQVIMPVAVFADTGKNMDFNPQVKMPWMDADPKDEYKAATTTVDGGGKAIKNYISNFYKFAIGLTGILATIMFAIGGLIWLTSGGSATQVGKAKQCITGSLTGLVLALSSYMILNTINPKIVELHWGKSIKALDEIGVGCAWVDRKCKNTYEKDSPDSCGAYPKATPKKSDKWHCCCAKDAKPETVAGAECIKKWEGAFIGGYFLTPPIGMSEIQYAKATCAEKCGGAKEWKKAEPVKSTTKEGFYACCLCVKDPIDLSNESCIAHYDCDVKAGRKEGEDRKWTCQNSVCKKCEKLDSNCSDNDQCCSGSCWSVKSKCISR